ncbi:MAG: hypothetical protein EPO07_14310 [Verrucomicrobia bacterium]|nr:MAG: hypothetical protein EPO07_14310 [Verrucomicrobiota bacterium]
MDLPLDSAVNPALQLTTSPGNIAGRPLEEWNAAYVKVESYFHALRIRNRVLLGQLVLKVLKQAVARASSQPNLSATQIAAEEMEKLVTDWFGEVLQHSPANAENVLSTRGRLALLLADMPGRWQDQFLRPGPWPPEFVKAMREKFIDAGPDFQISQMTPRPLTIGPTISLADLRNLNYRRMIIIWLLFFAALVAIFLLTH